MSKGYSVIQPTNQFAASGANNRTDLTAQLIEDLTKSVPVSPASFSTALMRGAIADARAGGYVIGRRHKEGHIPIIRSGEDCYTLIGYMEGGEFILNHEASVTNREELEKINADYANFADSDVYLEKHIPRIIDARNGSFTKAVWVDGNQFIVTRNATRNNLERLIEINESLNCYIGAEPLEALLSEYAEKVDHD